MISQVMAAAVRPLAVVPASDCEAIAITGIAQPVNTATGLGFLLAALIIFAATIRQRLTSAGYAIAIWLVANAIGTFGYHGWPGTVTHWVHDVALVGLLASIAGWHIARALDAIAATRGAWIGAGIGLLGGGLVAVVAPRATTALAVAAVVLIIAGEVAARRRGGGAAIGWSLAIVSILAMASYVVGHRDGPLCSPESALQFHGLWHLLVALVIVVWADRALAVVGPRVGAGLCRHATDVVAGLLCAVLIRAFHRSVDVIGRTGFDHRRPVLFVVNHGNGFVDPILLASTLRRLPRFIAKAALWKILPARIALDALFVLPVYRHSDGDDSTRNSRTFGSVERALMRRDRVAIFPEGTTADRGGLDRIRSGAARLALDAYRAGIREILIVPVGLAFESRVTTRTRASVTFGTAIDLDEWCELHPPVDESSTGTTDVATIPGESDSTDAHHRAAALTETIHQAMLAVSPVYASVDEREQLRLAAWVGLRHHRSGRVRFGDVEHCASRLAKAPEQGRTEIVQRLSELALRQQMVGIGDAEFDNRDLRRSGVQMLLAIAALIVFTPVFVAVALINLPVIIAVQLIVASVTETATKGTVRLLIGLLGGALSWWIAAMLLTDGALPVLATMVLLGALSALTLALWDWIRNGISEISRWYRHRDRRALLPALSAAEESLAQVVAQYDNSASTKSGASEPVTTASSGR